MKYCSFTLLWVFVFYWIGISPVTAQRRNASYEKYIKEYANLAIQHQNKYKIPASITLAQALLESGAGLSTLAKKSNNHFGIKCHSDWKGGRSYHDDDLKGECFRKYRRVSESYDDHSRFLAERSRYASLFKLNMRDYKGWARGLQKCGYATDRAYANKLIKIIEDYELYRYDYKRGTMPRKDKDESQKRGEAGASLARQVYKTHGLIYVLAYEGDSYEQIAQDVGFKVKKLTKYNEVPEEYPLRKGDIVYLQKKKSKADKPYYEHVVEIGESLHDISQRYGIRLKNLYKLNKKTEEYIPTEGDVLRLR